MLFVIKDVKIDGIWETFESKFIKDDLTLYPLLLKNGKDVFSYRGMTKVGKMFYSFQKPKRSTYIRSGVLSCLYQTHQETIKALGCFPFDFPDVIQELDDMKDLYTTYGIQDFRIIAWRV